jgi:hypothetical protein
MAGLHLNAQPVGEEALDQRGKVAAFIVASTPLEIALAITRSSNSGTASRVKRIFGEVWPI